jgi:hypothetical protein
MNTMYQNEAIATTASFREEEGQDTRTGNFLYQAATVLAILLFLISF